jgi:hypothetical protein
LVALALAFSTSSARTFASVGGIGEPGERKRVPRLSARSNSRWVSLRSSGVAYYAASAFLDSAFDLRGIKAGRICETRGYTNTRHMKP